MKIIKAFLFMVFIGLPVVFIIDFFSSDSHIKNYYNFNKTTSKPGIVKQAIKAVKPDGLGEEYKTKIVAGKCLRDCSPVLWKRYYGIFGMCSYTNQQKLGNYAVRHGITESISKFQKDNLLKVDGRLNKSTQKVCK